MTIRMPRRAVLKACLGAAATLAATTTTRRSPLSLRTGPALNTSGLPLCDTGALDVGHPHLVHHGARRYIFAW